MTQRLNYTTIAPAGIKALGSVYGYIKRSGLPGPLVNLVYLRVSQINGCVYCIDMHSRDLIKGSFTPAIARLDDFFRSNLVDSQRPHPSN